MLKLTVWDANGLCANEIAIMLVSETRFTDKSHLQIWNNKIYNTSNPSGPHMMEQPSISRNGIKHYELTTCTQKCL